jgi:hypothetical protein
MDRVIEDSWNEIVEETKKRFPDDYKALNKIDEMCKEIFRSGFYSALYFVAEAEMKAMERRMN